MNGVNNIKSVNIAGGGIAGLSSAHLLKRNGYYPIVYEKESNIGKSRHGDYEGIENWIFPTEINSFFEQLGFNFSKIHSFPISKFYVHTKSNKPLSISQPQPFFHMIKRGYKKTDLDFQLYNQCKSSGVEFRFGQKAPNDCNIIATGTSKAAAYIKGINFKTDLKDQIHLLLGNKFAPKGYAYLIILDGNATLATAFKKTKTKQKNIINKCKDYFESIGLSIPEGNAFASRGSFSLPFGPYQEPYKIGEAGGYQDYLFGFGIRMSMVSGMGAALYILGRQKEAKNVFRILNHKRRLSFINRFLYEKLNDDQMYGIVNKLSKSNDPISILSGIYGWNTKNILRWIKLKYRFEIHPT